MKFAFDSRTSDCSLVEAIWRTHSEGGGSFISSAASNMELVITRQQGGTWLTVRGPETKAAMAPVPEDAEFFGMTLKLGTFMPHLPASELVNRGINLPQASGQAFLLQGSAWQFPTFDNADTFVERLVRQGYLAYEPVVEAALQGRMAALSTRSLQRHFRRVTGLTHGTIVQIERARHAMSLLQQGVAILDTVEQAGYYDQPHLTRSMTRFIGLTPTQIIHGSGG